jgi:hypothetical protein
MRGLYEISGFDSRQRQPGYLESASTISGETGGAGFGLGGLPFLSVLLEREAEYFPILRRKGRLHAGFLSWIRIAPPPSVQSQTPALPNQPPSISCYRFATIHL